MERRDIIPNAWMRVVWSDERIDGALWWFGHVERMENDRFAKRIYIGECAGSRLMDRPWKRWIDIVQDCIRKSGLNVSQARRMLQDRSELWGFVRVRGRDHTKIL